MPGAINICTRPLANFTKNIYERLLANLTNVGGEP
jgi:hypothetical protein